MARETERSEDRVFISIILTYADVTSRQFLKRRNIMNEIGEV